MTQTRNKEKRRKYKLLPKLSILTGISCEPDPGGVDLSSKFNKYFHFAFGGKTVLGERDWNDYDWIGGEYPFTSIIIIIMEQTRNPG